MTEEFEPPLEPLLWIEPQAGVLAWLADTRPLRFVLVTSRRTGRWVFPKGGIEDGMTAADTAAQEAFEEAGLIGRPLPDPIGRYRTPKIRPPLIWTVEVALYTMRIDSVLDRWIEEDQRQRRFVTLEEARGLMDEPEMLALAEKFVAIRD